MSAKTASSTPSSTRPGSSPAGSSTASPLARSVTRSVSCFFVWPKTRAISQAVRPSVRRRLPPMLVSPQGMYLRRSFWAMEADLPLRP